MFSLWHKSYLTVFKISNSNSSKIVQNYKFLKCKKFVLKYHTYSSIQVKTANFFNDENRKENVFKKLKNTFLSLGIGLTGFGVSVIFKFGKPQKDEKGFLINDEYSNLPIHKQYLMRFLNAVHKFESYIQQPCRDKLLPDPPASFYSYPKYTLVLELSGILVHPDWTYSSGWRFKKRPGLDYFLNNLSGLYEIVIFTSEQGSVIDTLIDSINKNNLITYKLSKDATHFIDGHHVKNLNNLNRDLNKIIVIDWNEKSLKFQNDNLFCLKKWNGDDNDNTLFDLSSFLTTIAENEVENVREVLKYYKDFENPLATFRKKQKEVFG